jgi:hypothetical protein
MLSVQVHKTFIMQLTHSQRSSHDVNTNVFPTITGSKRKHWVDTYRLKVLHCKTICHNVKHSAWSGSQFVSVSQTQYLADSCTLSNVKLNDTNNSSCSNRAVGHHIISSQALWDTTEQRLVTSLRLSASNMLLRNVT